jgi:Tfp pilus assembly protein PilF
MLRALLLFVIASATACTAVPPRPAALSPVELLNLDLDLGAESSNSAPLVSRSEAFSVDEAMREFVATRVGTAEDQETKLEKLLLGMKEQHGAFSIEYESEKTRTAQQTFHEGFGNCLSFTMLFVALAREAGLRAEYQLVATPPTWSSSFGGVVVNRHINARIALPHGNGYVVDFAFSATDDRYRTHPVSDDYALALFYNNLGAEALLRREYDLSYRYLKAAIAIDSEAADFWTNLGVLFSRLGRLEQADAAYLRALEVNPQDQSALANLVTVQVTLGNAELAETYRARIRRYQERNPYYHYATAKNAYQEQRYGDAMTAINQALRLKRDDDEFHALQAQVRNELHAR